MAKSRLEAENIAAVNSISYCATKTINNLGIACCDNGKVSATLEEDLMPVVSSRIKVTLDLDKIEMTLGQGSLGAAIRRSLSCAGIDISSEQKFTAPLTGVVVAVPGKYKADDEDCSMATEAEIVPVYYNDDPNIIRARIFCLPATPDINFSLRKDFYQIKPWNMGYGVNGRGASNRDSALHIAEIIQSDLQQAYTDTAFLVAFARYLDLSDPKPERMRTMGAGISMMARISQGSAIQYTTRQVDNSGQKQFIGIELFAVGPIVVNTKGERLKEYQASELVKKMQRKAEQLCISTYAEANIAPLPSLPPMNETATAAVSTYEVQTCPIVPIAQPAMSSKNPTVAKINAWLEANGFTPNATDANGDVRIVMEDPALQDSFLNKAKIDTEFYKFREHGNYIVLSIHARHLLEFPQVASIAGTAASAAAASSAPPFSLTAGTLYSATGLFDKYYREGREAYKQKNIATALEKFLLAEKHLGVVATNRQGAFFYNIALCYFVQNDNQNALSYASKALQLKQSVSDSVTYVEKLIDQINARERQRVSLSK